MVGEDIKTTVAKAEDMIAGLELDDMVALGGSSGYYFIGTVGEYYDEINKIDELLESRYWKTIDYAAALETRIITDAGRRAVKDLPDWASQEEKDSAAKMAMDKIRPYAKKKAQEEVNKRLSKPYIHCRDAKIRQAYYRRTAGEPKILCILTNAPVVGDLWLMSEVPQYIENIQKREHETRKYIGKCREKYGKIAK